jgi:signal peptidase II
MLSKLRKFIFLILFFALADQLSKIFIIYYYEINIDNLNSQLLYSINKYINFHIVWNKGFAFGLFQNNVETINNIYMILIIVVTLGLFIYAMKIDKRIYFFSFSLIIGGAIGNLIDRYQYAAVLDFIDMHYNNFHWYVFNIADITITLGCILIIILEIFTNKKEQEENEIKN